MKTVWMAAACCALVACAASSPRIDPARISALQKGQTTVDEVVRQFGRPSVISRNPDGTQSATYLYGAEENSGTTIVPLLANTPADSTTFYFDTKGVLTDYKTRQTERPVPAQAAIAPAAADAQPATARAGSDKSPAAAPASAQPAAKKPAAPNITDRWPGSTTENR